MDEAIRELDWIAERGAKIILIRPAPVPSLRGFRSFALPEFDPFWAKVQEYDITVGMHASDDGLTRYFNQWEGHYDELLPFADSNGLPGRAAPHEPRHLRRHVLGGHPRHAVPVPRSCGSSRSRTARAGCCPLIDALGHSYAKQPKLYAEDPVEVLRRNIWIHPFFEENPLGLIKAIGTDHVVFGSDYPHPEGLADPVSYAKELESLLRGGGPQDHGRQPGRGAQAPGHGLSALPDRSPRPSGPEPASGGVDRAAPAPGRRDAA